jgi:hypothetical protein
MRRDLDAALAFRAGREVVRANQVILELCVKRAVPLVRSRGQPVLFGAANPLQLIVRAVASLRTCERHGPRFGLLGEEIAFVQRHARNRIKLSEIVR